MQNAGEPEVVRTKILIIDDEKVFTRLVMLNLTKTGKYEVREENDSSRALAAARKFKPDLILLDIMMPNLNGSEAASQIRNSETLKDVPIIFLTALAAKDDITSDGGLIGGYPFIAKPVSTVELIECIEKHLNKNR